jgi:Rod binding domain-containing protein
MSGLPDPASALPPGAAQPTPLAYAAPGDVAGARKAAEDFAAFFFSQSLESVFGSMSSDKMFGGGSGEDVYRSLLTQEYGKIVARTGGLGIADAVQREIIHMQEVQ